jgi:gluconate 2-dehydrogenase gamma chain
MRRREFLTVPAQTVGGLLIYSLAGVPILVHGEEPKREVAIPLRFFKAAEARVIAAACERILPADESGPGAREAGVVIYIDRQLAGPYGKDRFRYTKGPFVVGGPEHGYQGQANPQEIYREGIRQLGLRFADLSSQRQDELLRDMEKTLFFRMMHRHTIEGMFCDPLHGGNAGLIGWQLIGYPGPRMDYNYRDLIDKNFGRAWRAKPRDLEAMLGRSVKGWEDDDGG